jgi:WD40 repeat protein
VAVGELEGNVWIIDADEPTDASARIAFEPAPTSSPRALAFAPTGSGSSDEPLELVSAHTNGDVREWGLYRDDGFAFEQDVARGHHDEVTAVAFRPDGQLLSGGYDGEILWWGPGPTGGLAEVLPASGDLHASDVVDVWLLDEHGTDVVSLDLAGRLIATTEDGAGELWRTLDGVGTLDASGDVLAQVHGDGTISVTRGAPPGDGSDVMLPGDDSMPYLLDLSDDGTRLLSIGDAAVVWDVVAGSVRTRFAIPEEFFPATALYGPGDHVWLGGLDDEGPVVLEFDARSGEPVGDAIHHGGATGNHVSALAVSSDGTTLATGGTDRAIRLWDPVTHEPLPRGHLSGHRETVTDLAFTPDGDGVISVDRDGVVNLWDVPDRQLVTTFTGPTDGINALAVSADGLTLVVASEDDNVYRWSLDRREWIERACELATRNMTAVEWELYGRGPQERLCNYPGDGPLVDWSRRVEG